MHLWKYSSTHHYKLETAGACHEKSLLKSRFGITDYVAVCNFRRRDCSNTSTVDTQFLFYMRVELLQISSLYVSALSSYSYKDGVEQSVCDVQRSKN